MRTRSDDPLFDAFAREFEATPEPIAAEELQPDAQEGMRAAALAGVAAVCLSAALVIAGAAIALRWWL